MIKEMEKWFLLSMKRFPESLEQKCNEKKDTHFCMICGDNLSKLPALKVHSNRNFHASYFNKEEFIKVNSNNLFLWAFEVLRSFVRPFFDDGKYLILNIFGKLLIDILLQTEC